MKKEGPARAGLVGRPSNPSPGPPGVFLHRLLLSARNHQNSAANNNSAASGHVHQIHQNTKQWTRPSSPPSQPKHQNTKGHSNSLPGQLTKYTEHNFSINIKPTKTPNTKPSPKTISFMCSKSTKLKHVYQRQERKPCKQAIDRSHLIQTTRDFSLTRFYSLTRN